MEVSSSANKGKRGHFSGPLWPLPYPHPRRHGLLTTPDGPYPPNRQVVPGSGNVVRPPGQPSPEGTRGEPGVRPLLLEESTSLLVAVSFPTPGGPLVRLGGPVLSRVP